MRKWIKTGIAVVVAVILATMFRSCTRALDESRARIIIRLEKQREPQVILVDPDGNKLWRAYDSERAEFIYYIPKWNTSWEQSNGRSTETMVVR